MFYLVLGYDPAGIRAGHSKISAVIGKAFNAFRAAVSKSVFEGAPPSFTGTFTVIVPIGVSSCAGRRACGDFDARFSALSRSPCLALL